MNRQSLYIFVAVFLGCTSTLWFYVQELPKAQPAVVLVLKRLRRRGIGLKSHPTDWEKPGIGTCDPWFTRHRFIPYTTAASLTIVILEAYICTYILFVDLTFIFGLIILSFVFCHLCLKFCLQKGIFRLLSFAYCVLTFSFLLLSFVFKLLCFAFWF